MDLKSSAFGALLPVASVADATSRKIVEPLDPTIVAAHHVVGVEVVASPTATETFKKLEALAVTKRTKARLPAIDPAAPVDVSGPRPDKIQYATLPFVRMLLLVVADVTREWGLTAGREVKLKVTVDTLKMANPGVTLLLGSSDQLAGLVEVLEAADNVPLGSFYIDVINSHGGLACLAMRGSGVRESLSEEFALESSRVLTGRKSKTVKVAKE